MPADTHVVAGDKASLSLQALLTCVSLNGEPGHGPSELGSAMNQIRSEVTEDEPRYVKRNHMMW